MKLSANPFVPWVKMVTLLMVVRFAVLITMPWWVVPILVTVLIVLFAMVLLSEFVIRTPAVSDEPLT